LIEEREIQLERRDVWARRKRKPVATGERSSGVHLSGIIRHCLIETGKATARELDDDELPLRMAVGMAWEEWMAGLWPDMIWQPGEKELDQVVGSPDGITVEGVEEPLLEEIKCTWKSRKTYGDVVNQSLWMWQLAGYLKMLKLVRARMHILWVCGDYKQGPPSPAYVTYTVAFTQEEIDRFWRNVVLKNRDSVLPEIH
jgi:hypothetical protein